MTTDRIEKTVLFGKGGIGKSTILSKVVELTRQARAEPVLYNEAGHEALAGVFHRATLEVLDRRAGAAPSLPKAGETWYK